MTNAEFKVLFCELKTIFSTVRLVDVSLTLQYTLDETGELVQESYICYAVWNRDKRCENCISAKAYRKKCMMTKFEFINNDVYFIISKYIKIENTPYILEMVTTVNDETLFGVYGKNSFINTINSYNKQLNLDTLTEAYNRRYYNEQLSGLPKINAVAMIDVDNFKKINDNYGHPTGDFLLQKIVAIIQEQISGMGAVVRFGGDEFVLTLQGVSKQRFLDTLETIRKLVAEIQLKEHPNLITSVSIGAVYCISNATEMLNEADKALYEAKKERNKVKVKVF